jgi:energy-coupling factor transporter ATP-binding protein EcfA2
LLDRIRILRSRGITVIVVEHNMDLVMNVADRIMVMEYGRHLFQGGPAEVQKNPAVIAAYLGGELSRARCYLPKGLNSPMRRWRFVATFRYPSKRVKSLR